MRRFIDSPCRPAADVSFETYSRVTTMAAFATVKIDEQSFRQAEAFLTQIPLEMRTNVIPKALKAAAKPVVKRAEQLAPDSVRSGSRLKWSAKIRSKRASAAQLKDTIISSRVKVNGSTLRIFVWPMRGPGNLINVLGHPHKQMAWGRQTGIILPPVQFLVQASEQTYSEQQSEFVSKVKSETEKILAKGAKP